MKPLALCATLALVLLGSEAKAALSSVTMTHLVNETNGNALGVEVNTWQNLFLAAGRYAFDVHSTLDPNALDYNMTLYTYCLDVDVDATGSAVYEALPMVNFDSEKNIALGQLARGAFLSTGGTNPWEFTNVSSSGFLAASFQLAVWEIMHETNKNAGFDLSFGGDMSHGSFYATNGWTGWETAVANADYWLSLLHTIDPLSIGDGLYALVPQGDPPGQAQGILLPGSERTVLGVIPEPSSLCLWAGLALIGCGVRYRRRRSPA
jgi:hypothetical protein